MARARQHDPNHHLPAQPHLSRGGVMPHLDMSTFTVTVIPITKDNLPVGPRYEDDGSCWRAILDRCEPNGWRWQPLNWTAFGKGEPDSEMTDVFLPPNAFPTQGTSHE